ncbi:MAG: hypothetical protein V4577_15625 [Bacteroidota bacterium]
MPNEDQVIKLVVKKMTGRANPNELQELDDLFEKDAALYKALQLLFTDRTEAWQPPDDRSRLLFEKIKAKINSNI